MTYITVVIGSCLCVLDAPFEHIFIGYRTKVTAFQKPGQPCKIQIDIDVIWHPRSHLSHWTNLEVIDELSSSLWTKLEW